MNKMDRRLFEIEWKAMVAKALPLESLEFLGTYYIVEPSLVLYDPVFSEAIDRSNREVVQRYHTQLLCYYRTDDCPMGRYTGRYDTRAKFISAATLNSTELVQRLTKAIAEHDLFNIETLTSETIYHISQYRKSWICLPNTDKEAILHYKSCLKNKLTLPNK